LKKTTVAAVLSTAIVCFIFWLLITGQVVSLVQGNPNTQVLIAGGIVSLCVALFCAKFFIHEKAFFFVNPWRLVKLIVYCLIIFPIELFKANWDVAKRALSPKLPINPGIVKVPVNVKSEYAQSTLANSITLTPGTIIMNTVEEDGQDYFYIHWINVTSTDGTKAGEAIKGTLEKWARRIWE